VIGTDAWAAPYGNSPYGRINSTLELTSIVPYVVDTKKRKKHSRCKKFKTKSEHSENKKLSHRKKRKHLHKWHRKYE
jgi:hypothetical protein